MTTKTVTTDLQDISDRVHQLHSDLHAVSKAYRLDTERPHRSLAFDDHGLAISVACNLASGLADAVRLVRVQRGEM